jgi:hypothetical protein
MYSRMYEENYILNSIKFLGHIAEFSFVEAKIYLFIKKNLLGFESAIGLYRSSDRRRSAKLVPTLADRGCNLVSATNPSDRNFYFLGLEPLLFLPSCSSIVHEAEWTPFQTHCCSEISVNAGNRNPVLVARNSDH